MESEKKSQYINISFLTLFKIMVALVLFFVMYFVRDILAVFFVSLIFASALDPWVDWMENKRIPRGFGIIIIYFLLFLVLSASVFLLIPPISSQVNELMSSYPQIQERIASSFSLLKGYSFDKESIKAIFTQADNIPGLTEAISGLFSSALGFFWSIFSFFIVLVITFYMVVEEDSIKKIIWSVAPAKNQIYIMKLVTRMQRKIGLWLRGQILLSFIIFLLTYAGLSILGVKYALVLAVIAGLTEFIPYLGPMIAAIPAMFLAFTQGGPVFMLFTGALYYVIQLTENNIIVPKLMQKVVGLNPIVTLAVLMIGFKIAFIVGMILAIPVATAINVFIKDVIDKKAFSNE